MFCIRPRSHGAWSSTVHLCRRTCLLQRLRASTLVIGPQVHSRSKRPCGTPAANRRAGGEHADLAKARALILISLMRWAPKPATVLRSGGFCRRPPFVLTGLIGVCRRPPSNCGRPAGFLPTGQRRGKAPPVSTRGRHSGGILGPPAANAAGVILNRLEGGLATPLTTPRAVEILD